MCSNFDPVSKPERMRLHFGVDGPTAVKQQVWPLYKGSSQKTENKAR